jgi:hypothetical protein
MANRIDKIKPAPLPFPNGGGLDLLASNSEAKLKDLEHQILDLKTQLGHHHIDKKYTPKTTAPKKPAAKRSSKRGA